jgi:microcystin degradation protein MlrC
LLVHSEGGSISREQRDRLVQAMRGVDPRTAVVTASASVHFVASAISLAKRNLRCFTPGELPQAFEYLELDAEVQPFVRATLARLRASLGLTDLSVAG